MTGFTHCWEEKAKTFTVIKDWDNFNNKHAVLLFQYKSQKPFFSVKLLEHEHRFLWQKPESNYFKICCDRIEKVKHCINTMNMLDKLCNR